MAVGSVGLNPELAFASPSLSSTHETTGTSQSQTRRWQRRSSGVIGVAKAKLWAGGLLGAPAEKFTIATPAVADWRSGGVVAQLVS